LQQLRQAITTQIPIDHSETEVQQTLQQQLQPQVEPPRPPQQQPQQQQQQPQLPPLQIQPPPQPPKYCSPIVADPDDHDVVDDESCTTDQLMATCYTETIRFKAECNGIRAYFEVDPDTSAQQILEIVCSGFHVQIETAGLWLFDANGTDAILFNEEDTAASMLLDAADRYFLLEPNLPFNND
jgi:hypothetical protein